MITVGTLVIGGLHPAVARKICDDLVAACVRFKIDTPAQQGGFVAQCAVESNNFTQLEENLNYTTPGRILAVFPGRVKSVSQAVSLCRNPKLLANTVYAGRNGNDPDPAVGDGARFAGRGWLMTTGKDNYTLAAIDCGMPFLDEPELLGKHPGAAMSAAAFWVRNGCGPFAEARKWDEVTRRINGRAMLEKTQRAWRSAKFMDAFTG